MMKLSGKCLRVVLAGAAASALLLSGCTKRPSEDQKNQLDEARGAAVAAETTKSQLIQERRTLELQVNEKRSSLAQHEAERDDIQQKMQERN